MATSGISCPTKDGKIADCSQDPAIVKQAIKLIEKDLILVQRLGRFEEAIAVSMDVRESVLGVPSK